MNEACGVRSFDGLAGWQPARQQAGSQRYQEAIHPKQQPAISRIPVSFEPTSPAPAKPIPAVSLPFPANSLVAANKRPNFPAHLGSNSLAPAGPQPKPAAPLNPVRLDKLRLNAIAAFGKRRAAEINGQSIFQGQEVEFDVDGDRLKVRCLEIKGSSALVQVAGIAGTTELKMPALK